ncbi:MAG TPA: response regulator transcription factor [Bryobacteraceae bacterium]
MIRVLIAASSALIRAGLVSLLVSEGLEVVGNAATLEEAATLTSDTPVDVLVAELEEPGDEFPSELAAVLLLDPPLPEWAAEAVRGGVRGLLPRQVDAAELAGAVRAAAAGLVTVHPQFLDELFTSSSGSARGLLPLQPGQSLSPREIEVLRMLADGLGNKIIAHRLGISEHTVKFHVASIMAKLDAASRTEAVTQGIRRGIIML